MKLNSGVLIRSSIFNFSAKEFRSPFFYALRAPIFGCWRFFITPNYVFNFFNFIHFLLFFYFCEELNHQKQKGDRSMMMRGSMLGALLGFALLACVTADLPMHCLHDQALGTWMLQLTADTGNSYTNCYDPAVYGKIAQSVELQLADPDIAYLGGVRGYWTFIYDEGIEATIGNQKYFFYFDYVTNANQTVTSYCDRSLPGSGYWRSLDSKQFGCAQAILLSGPLHRLDADSVNQYEMKTVSVEHMDAVYVPETKFVEAMNARGDLPFTMSAYEEMKGTPMSHFHKRGGSLQSKPKSAASMMYAGVNPVNVNNKKMTMHLDDATLPAAWDWSNVSGVSYVPPVRNQQSCGSCYAFGTTGMLASRVRILTQNKNQIVLSPQYVVSCGNPRYDQGCNGGFAYLVSAMGQSWSLVSETCYPYQGVDSKCNDVSSCPASERIFVDGYYYVGGYYGACSELEMMREIYTNGPVAVSFEVTSAFQMYKGGVYVEPKESMDHLLVNRWELTNHIVFIVGWGTTTDGIPFWRVQNSWSENWGEQGYFRIRRGTDELAIESMALAATPRV
jgi:cathepsin C